MTDETKQTTTPKSAKTVTVACKMPNGMLLRHCEERTEMVQGSHGPVPTKINRTVGEGVRVFGPAVPVGQSPKCLIVGGYALTPGIDAAFMEKWMAQYKDSDLVKNRIIFIQASSESAQAQATEQEAVRSGLEPLDPTFTTGKKGEIIPADPRYPRSQPGVSAPHLASDVA